MASISIKLQFCEIEIKAPRKTHFTLQEFDYVLKKAKEISEKAIKENN